MRYLAAVLVAGALSVGGAVHADCGDDTAHHEGHEHTTAVSYHAPVVKKKTVHVHRVVQAKPVVKLPTDGLRIVRRTKPRSPRLTQAANAHPADQGSIMRKGSGR